MWFYQYDEPLSILYAVDRIKWDNSLGVFISPIWLFDSADAKKKIKQRDNVLSW